MAYTVKSGDTLGRLATQFATTVAKLQEWNGLGSSTTIYAGYELSVPIKHGPAGDKAPPVVLPPPEPVKTAFYRFPNSQVANWVAANPGDARMAAVRDRLAAYPASLWVGGGWTSNGRPAGENATAAKSAGQIPVMVVYNIPNRDNGGYSSGGAANASAYRQWIDNLALDVGSKPVWCVLEPDALAFYADGANMDLSCLAYAVTKLKANPNARVYIDAGTAGWPGSVDRLVSGLKIAGVDQADGFALNVSNFFDNAQNAYRGRLLSERLGGAHFVVDTSRNGNGSNGQWCNPPGRAVGMPPTTNTGVGACDAYLWVKLAGESDGTCNGGPAAGKFSPELAYDLVNG